MTGREALKELIGNDGDRIADALKKLGFACVPIEPTASMLREAYYEALAEDASGVWREMIRESQERTG